MHRPFFFLVPLICLSSALWAAPATVNVEVLQDKLDHPWSLAFLPDNHGMLITLRGGELRHWQKPGRTVDQRSCFQDKRCSR